MKATKLIILILCLIFALTSSVFAWFVMMDRMNDLNFKMAKIDSLVSFFEGIDGNKDGILDYGRDSGEGTEIAEHPLYTLLNTQPALGNQITNIQTTLVQGTLQPTERSTFKIRIINNSDARNVVRLSYVGYTAVDWQEEDINLYDGDDFDGFLSALRVMSVTIVILEDDGITVNSSTKLFFANLFDNTTITSDGDNRLFNFDISNNTVVEGILDATADNDLEYLLIFELETLETLTSAVVDGGAGLTMTRAQYDAYQNSNVLLPVLRIYLEIPG